MRKESKLKSFSKKRLVKWLALAKAQVPKATESTDRIFLEQTNGAWKFLVSGVRLHKVSCIGLISRTGDNQHILMCDYDNIFWKVVKRDIEWLQNVHGYGICFVFSTKREFKDQKEEIGNYHLYFLEKRPFEDVRTIMGNLHCDKQHLVQERFFEKGWVLRISEKGERGKPVFVGIVSPKVPALLSKSNAHRGFLLKYVKGLNISKTKEFDELENIELTEYETLA